VAEAMSDTAAKLPYTVECDHEGCSQCGHDRMWTIVDSDGIGAGQSWGDKEFVDDLCEMLNDAFEKGKASKP
jgi:predicted GTPase